VTWHLLLARWGSPRRSGASVRCCRSIRTPPVRTPGQCARGLRNGVTRDARLPTWARAAAYSRVLWPRRGYERRPKIAGTSSGPGSFAPRPFGFRMRKRGARRSRPRARLLRRDDSVVTSSRAESPRVSRRGSTAPQKVQGNLQSAVAPSSGPLCSEEAERSDRGCELVVRAKLGSAHRSQPRRIDR